MSEIRIYKSVAQGLKLISLSSVFVVPSVYFLIQGEDDALLWWVSLFFFSLGYPIGLYLILDRRPQIIINEIGIFDRNLGNNVINWEIIMGAYIKQLSQQTFICLEVDEDFEPSHKKGKFYRSFARLNKELGFQELNIVLTNVRVKPDRLLRLIQLMAEAEMPARQVLLQEGLNRD